MKKIDGLIQDSRELARKFSETYIEINAAARGGLMVVYCRMFEGDRAVFYNPNGDTLRLDDDDYEIVREFPRLGAINHNGNVHFLSRIPYRQWRRGLHREVIKDFNRCGDVSPFSYDLSRKRAQAIFNPEYPESFAEALVMLREGVVKSVAVNSTYWLSGNGKRTYFWRKEVPVGEVKDGKVVFFPDTVSLKQETIDFLGEKNVVEEV